MTVRPKAFLPPLFSNDDTKRPGPFTYDRRVFCFRILSSTQARRHTNPSNRQNFSPVQVNHHLRGSPTPPPLIFGYSFPSPSTFQLLFHNSSKLFSVSWQRSKTKMESTRRPFISPRRLFRRRFKLLCILFFLSSWAKSKISPNIDFLVLGCFFHLLGR